MREKTPQRVVCVSSHKVGAFYFSQKNTEEQNTQHSTETLSQPISQNLTANRGLTPSPSPNEEGSDHRDTPTFPPYVKQLISYHQQAKRGNLTYYSPRHSERGWGWGLCEFCMPEAFCEFETVRKNVLLNLWVLWEKKLTSNSQAPFLLQRVRSISHRSTQKNRTHKLSQRH